MPKKIEHEERKITILKKALEIFARDGYRDSNLSTIAQECGLSRPTLYQYFKDKKEIYYYAVKLVTGKRCEEYSQMGWDDSYGKTRERIAWKKKEKGGHHLAADSS